MKEDNQKIRAKHFHKIVFDYLLKNMKENKVLIYSNIIIKKDFIKGLLSAECLRK